MQEAYRPRRIKYSICCPVLGGYPCQGEYPILGWGYPGVPHLDLARVTPIQGWVPPSRDGVPQQGYLPSRGTLPADHTCRFYWLPESVRV